MVAKEKEFAFQSNLSVNVLSQYVAFPFMLDDERCNFTNVVNMEATPQALKRNNTLI